MFNNISLLIKDYCVSLKTFLKYVDALTRVKVKRVKTLILNWTFTSIMVGYSMRLSDCLEAVGKSVHQQS